MSVVRPLVRSLAVAGVVLAGVALAWAALALALPAKAQPAAAPPGAVACGGCHATGGSGDGISDLKGLKSTDIASAMLDYKAGARAPTIMNRIAKGFSESEIKAIADWLEAHP